MFTKRKIWLSELLEGGALSIVRDAEIAFAGKLSTPLNDRIVPLQSQDHLERATRSDGTTAFITPEGLSQKIPDQFGLIIAPYPMAALAHVQSKLANHPTLQWDRFETRIHPSAQIDRSASIAPFDVTIGADTVIFPGAIIGPRTAIGARCSIGPNTHIGATGFQKDAGTPGHLMAQSGGVRIADDVTIQSSCVVSRAVFGGFTEINSEVLIDS
ncbi:MAG: hypothetical protein OXD48_09305, partial [Litoreibacter sp.]|nr:hypothetical protein [Litoreibacter sp.]